MSLASLERGILISMKCIRSGCFDYTWYIGMVLAVLGHFGHGRFGHGRFGQDVSATDISATDISATDFSAME